MISMRALANGFFSLLPRFQPLWSILAVHGFRHTFLLDTAPTLAYHFS
jgi:hypothetical protein